MQQLGQTRSSRQADHFLLTPDTFVRAPLPGMQRATAIVHAAPAHGAGFTEYTAEFEPGGELTSGLPQMFIYVFRGELEINRRSLPANGFAYLPGNRPTVVSAICDTVAVVIEKPWISTDQSQPDFFTGVESDVPSTALMGDGDLAVRSLIPISPAFDFAVNTMTFAPGASLPMVEIHVMEHGLLMLEGGGIYRLNDRWYPVTAGDFIYMAPYCPQWFAAVGKQPAKYLIYKDWNRHPLA